MEDHPAMNDWVGKARVSGVTAKEEVESRTRDPFFCFDIGQRGPGKRALRDRLIEAVNSKRVVCGRPAKLIARMTLRFWRYINVGARINQPSSPIDRET
jgi:hypothetical protein